MTTDVSTFYEKLCSVIRDDFAKEFYFYSKKIVLPFTGKIRPEGVENEWEIRNTTLIRIIVNRKINRYESVSLTFPSSNDTRAKNCIFRRVGGKRRVEFHRGKGSDINFPHVTG